MHDQPNYPAHKLIVVRAGPTIVYARAHDPPDIQRRGQHSIRPPLVRCTGNRYQEPAGQAGDQENSPPFNPPFRNDTAG